MMKTIIIRLVLLTDLSGLAMRSFLFSFL